jgi:hypothetical protein
LLCEETVSEHDQSQVPMESIPASSLEVIQTTFLLGIFVKLLDDPTSMCQQKQSRERGVFGQDAEPVLDLLFLLLLRCGRLCCKKLQRGKLGVMVSHNRSYIATPNSFAMKVTWSLTSPFSTPCTCPFRIMFMISYRITPREILPAGKMFVLFLLIHCGACMKISGSFKQLLEMTNGLAFLANSGKISRGARVRRMMVVALPSRSSLKPLSIGDWRRERAGCGAFSRLSFSLLIPLHQVWAG